MRILELLKLLMDNKDVILELLAFIQQFFPSDTEPVVFSAVAAEEKFPTLAVACSKQSLTLEELAEAVQKWKDTNPVEGGES